MKDLIFPGNLQEIMNKVLAAERTSQAQLVEARTRAEVQRIDAETKAETTRRLAESQAEADRLAAAARAEAVRLEALAEVETRQASRADCRGASRSIPRFFDFASWSRSASSPSLPRRRSTSISTAGHSKTLHGRRNRDISLQLDQGLPRSAADHLRRAGIDAVHPGEIGMATALNASALLE